MRYLKYTYVDAVSGVPVTDTPARNGPVPPAIEGLVFGFALESQYPTMVPMLYGTCPDGDDINAPGVLAELTEAEYQAALAGELEAQRVVLVGRIAARRYQAETAGITLNGIAIDTSRDSQALITGAALSAMLDPGYVCRWKTSSGFVELTAEQIIGAAQAVRAHVQAAFDREAELLGLLPNVTLEQVDSGWPA